MSHGPTNPLSLELTQLNLEIAKLLNLVSRTDFGLGLRMLDCEGQVMIRCVAEIAKQLHLALLVLHPGASLAEGLELGLAIILSRS